MNQLDYTLNFLDYVLTIVRSSPKDILEYQKIRHSIRLMQAEKRDPEPKEIEKLNDIIMDLRSTLQAEGKDIKFLPEKAIPKLSAAISDISTMARTIYGESDKSNVKDANAVAWVIRNRFVYNRHAWGLTLEDVCKKSSHFNCWETSSPDALKKNRAMLDVDYNDPWFRTCTTIAGAVLKGEIPDPTFRSTHYLLNKANFPTWAKDQTPVLRLDWKRAGVFHAFFNDIDTPPPHTSL